jgi:hypothetical protein
MKKAKSNKQAIEELTAAVLVNTIFLAVQTPDKVKNSTEEQNKDVVDTVVAMWTDRCRQLSS